MSIIELQNVSKLYGFGDATTLALDDINLTVEAGEFVAIMGPSGCGKSTLMHAIGLLDRPTHGEYRLHGRQVSRLRPNQAAKIRRDTIGFIFQSYNLIPRMTVLENVALPLLYKGVSLTKRLKTASSILERVGMRTREYFLPSQLSGGQIQCAAIARALVNNPKLIIADEPTGNLDTYSSRLVMELLGEIHKMGNTILFVTHNPELTRYASRIIYMRDGAIIHDEQTPIGHMPDVIRSTMLIPKMSVEDDIAGVSALMDTVPEAPAPDESPHKKHTPTRTAIRSGRRRRKVRT
jgi:putative ABC transport system ATP-binding protein